MTTLEVLEKLRAKLAQYEYPSVHAIDSRPVFAAIDIAIAEQKAEAGRESEPGDVRNEARCIIGDIRAWTPTAYYPEGTEPVFFFDNPVGPIISKIIKLKRDAFEAGYSQGRNDTVESCVHDTRDAADDFMRAADVLHLHKADLCHGCAEEIKELLADNGVHFEEEWRDI